ncbi:hypothetical protein BDV39DRAFT_195603 [Aspergillus sergii]|uniref:NmrA-like domain-containing protein n=1 Tax=Aspergillus sergii TaxID=1034303 RepID=A0A5N6WWR4_9EURO|nr:hypothetical protein BDV39DRAFT_195603 [Aspergillus sergii]
MCFLSVTVRKADYDELETLEMSLLLMLISYAPVEIEYRSEAHQKATTATHSSSVSHIFYSSLAFGGNCEKTSVCHVMGAHLATELFSSITYTAIREGLYSELFSVYLAMFDHRHPVEEITIPHSGFVDEKPGDIPLYESEETVQVLGRVTGKHLMIREVSADEDASLPQLRNRFMYHGVNLASEYTTSWEAFRRGEAAVMSHLPGEILGRDPERFETTVRGMLDS